MRQLLPLYVHPLEDPHAWRALDRDSTVVVNVHNGPGERLDESYVEVTERLAAAGVPMLGYVDLGYGRRDPAAVRRDARAWHRYPVGGLFFDQAPSGPAQVPLVREALKLTGPAVLNFGTRPDPSYRDCPALVCTFEGPWAAYLKEGCEPDWPNATHLVYGVPAELTRSAVNRVWSRVEFGFVTGLNLPNPYAGRPDPAVAVARRAPR